MTKTGLGRCAQMVTAVAPHQSGYKSEWSNNILDLTYVRQKSNGTCGLVIHIKTMSLDKDLKIARSIAYLC